MNTLGLDISTAIVGWTILDDQFNIIKMSHIDFKKCKTFWEKVDYAVSELTKILTQNQVDNVYVEESLMRFSPGFSSASTIITLAKFNVLISYAVRNAQGTEPQYVGANDARRKCGIKLLQKKKVGIDYKTQAFNWCKAGPLSHLQFPLTKTGKIKPFVMDETDSYIIARAGVILISEAKNGSL